MNKTSITPSSRDFMPAPAYFPDRSALLCAIELEIPLHHVTGHGDHAGLDPRAVSRDSMAHPAYRRFLTTNTARQKRDKT